MSKEFRPYEDSWAARWNELDGFDLNVNDWAGIGRDLLPAFIAWLQEGPPKRRYRITRTFEARPGLTITFEGATHSRLGSEGWLPLSDADVEEVWE